MVQFLPSKRPPERGGNAAPLFLVAVVLIAMLCVGCGNNCFIFVSNPSNGVTLVGAITPGSACFAPQPQGSVRITAHLARVCEACSDANRIRRVFLAVRGIEIHPATPDAQSEADWQELQPWLEQHPLQIELGSLLPDVASGIALGETAAIPAGSYDLVRLRLVRDQTDVISRWDRTPVAEPS